MGIHENNRIFKCDLCHKRFNFDENLQEHIKNVHEKENKVSCEFCGKTEADRKYLKRHILMTHDVDKKFQCTICEARFTLSQYLKQHLKTHNITGESCSVPQNLTPNVKMDCEVCGLSFKPSSMSRHMKRHTSVKPKNKDIIQQKACDICDKLVTYLDRHKKFAHSEDRHL